jgi:hypothetical protein
VRLTWQVPVSTSSIGRLDRRPHAEPLLGTPGFVSLYLGEAQLCREAHRADVGGLGFEHHRLAGKRVVEPVECRCGRLGGVPESQQLDERRSVPGLGLTEHEPLGPDRDQAAKRLLQVCQP